MQISEVIGFTCVFAFTLAGMLCDLRTRKLPNALTAPAFGAGLLFHAVNGFYRAGFSEAAAVNGFYRAGFLGAAYDLRFALAGFAVGFGILLVLWLIGGSGGGDVKFMGALGCWLGAWLTFQALVLSAFLAGAITLVIVGGNVFRLQRINTGQPDVTSKNTKDKKDRSAGTQRLRSRENWVVPFGVPIALATWIIVALEWSGHGLPWPPIK